MSSVIEIAGNRFYNCDAIAGAREYLEPNCVDLVITDPPYGIEGDRLHRHYNRDENFVVEGYVEIPRDEYGGFTQAWIAQAERVLRPGGSLYALSGYSNLYDVLHALRATNLREVNHLIWKFNFGVYTNRKYVSSHYHILYYEKPGGNRTFNLQSRHSMDETAEKGGSANYRDREDVFIINREYKPGREKNKNELPKELLQKLLQYSSKEGDLVCDFFLGGCSTAAVAIGMNRRFVGFEISESIFEKRVLELKNVKPGELLPKLRRPEREHRVANSGKLWNATDLDTLAERYRSLKAEGKRKNEIVRSLSSHFDRGSWSIIKQLKRIDQ